MSLIVSERPKSWNSVVGQNRALSTLKAALGSGQFTPRGIIVSGPWGTGKTTLAYLAAKSLMCLDSTEGVSCGKCASCLQSQALDSHPDFIEVDAASNSGVADARQLLQLVEAFPILGKRRVVLIDEAHRLSREAWDVFLKPIETDNGTAPPCVFIFATTDLAKIPYTIKSRCCKVPLALVDDETIVGLLYAICGKYGIKHEPVALELIARHANGHIRDAVNALDEIATAGPVTKASAATYLDASSEAALRILVMLAGGKLIDAVQEADEFLRANSANKLIEALFVTYSRAIFSARADLSEHEQSLLNAIKAALQPFQSYTSVFLKWHQAVPLPPDVIPILLLELANAKGVVPTATIAPPTRGIATAQAPALPKRVSSAAPQVGNPFQESKALPADRLASMIGATVQSASSFKV